MLIRFFTRSFIVQYFTIALTALVLWSLCLPGPPLMPAPEGPVPLYTLLYDLLHDIPFAGVLAGFVLVLLEAFLLNSLFASNDLIPKNSSIAAFLFVLIMSSDQALMTLTPVHISILFLLYILRNIFLSYYRTEPVDLAFTSGFLITLSALFYLPMILFYGFLLTSFLVYRSMHWREWIGSFIGVITPVLFLATGYFWMDQVPERIAEYEGFARDFIFENPWGSYQVLIPGGFTLVLGLLGIGYMSGHVSEKTVETRKKMIMLFWLIFWALASAPFARHCLGWHIYLLAVTFAPFTGNFFLGVKKQKRWGAVLILYIAVIVSLSLMKFVA